MMIATDRRSGLLRITDKRMNQSPINPLSIARLPGSRLTRLLIANRGEIAVRIIRACNELGIRTVAVYSEADAHAMHVRLADEAVPIGPPPPNESYLRIDRIIDAAKTSGAQAIHPGFGFLAESADFADAVRDMGLIFVGPSGEAIRKMGNKTRARAIMERAGVPIVPGYQGALEADFGEVAGTIGYPVLVKAAAGGGGKGMRIVRRADELWPSIESAQREAHGAFGDETIFLEKYIEGAHHIEFQVFGDVHGNVVHLFERECSTQRRHQKIVEETPSPLLDRDLRERMGSAAVAAAQAVNYHNAGTIEFIVEQETRAFYFLEMNTRLQVEHPITEAVTGLDLVKLQIKVAMGEPLPFGRGGHKGSPMGDKPAIEDKRIGLPLPVPRGHAIECRVYAEDPANNFLPAVGMVLKAEFPMMPGVRVDAGIESGDEVSIHYDPMIAKIIAHGQDRLGAIRRMDQALARTTILGVTTNIRFLRDLLAQPAFTRGEVTTDFIERQLGDWKSNVNDASDLALIAAALSDVERGTPGPTDKSVDRRSTNDDPWHVSDGFRLGS